MIEDTVKATWIGPDVNHIAIRNTVLRGLVGSTVHGTSVGTDDRDEIGICIEPPEFVIGMLNFESYIYRSATERTGKNDARSAPGDLDLTVYTLRKWCKLAVAGNPSILLIMFTPRESCNVWTRYSQLIRDLAPAIASKQAGLRFLGYLKAQRERLLGVRGGHKPGNRPELTEVYGYDTKYAGHIVRLGIQGIEYMSTGQLSLPMDFRASMLVKDVRNGRFTLKEVLDIAADAEATLTALVESGTTLPEYPDYQAVNRFLIETYHHYWSSNGYL